MDVETNAIQFALKLLDRRAYSEAKLRQKMEQSGIFDLQSELAIARLKSWGYLDDREYGKNRVRALQIRLKSREYVRGDLTEDGLEGGLVDELLSEFYPWGAELEIARDFLKKRVRPNQKTVLRARSEWTALVRAGFSEETIRDCLPEILI